MSNRLSVLFIEDNQDDAILTIRLLKQAGYEVFYKRVETGEEMTEVLPLEPWDLILSDYSMPCFSVQEALDIYHSYGRDIPFIVISGAIGEERAVQLIKDGVHDYLLKNHMTRFVQVVERELREARVRRELIKVREALVLSEEKYKSYLENAPDGVFVADDKGQMIEVNPSACKITGFTEEDLLKMSVRDLFPEETRESENKQFGALMETGSLREDFEIRLKDGSKRWLALDAIRLSENQFLGFVKDITQRKQTLLELVRTREDLQQLNEHIVEARENERATIALEIHDELGQSLTAIKIDMKWVQDHLREHEKSTVKIAKIINMTNETIKKVQRISAELRPGILDDLGLASAMEWYCSEFEQRTGISCELILEELPETDQRFNLSLYRIFQEAMTNIIRHAHAHTVRISLCHKPEGIYMIIEDDGVGIPKEKIKDGKSMGLIGIRERARQINGTVEFTSHEGPGTKLITFVPTATKEPDAI